MAHYYLFHQSTISIAPVYYLQDSFTSGTARRKGIGKALIEAEYAHARLGGASRVYWHTQETNLTARKLYDWVGEHSAFVVYRKLL